MNLGKAYLENREAAKAVEALNRAVQLDPTSTPAWRNLARAHLLTNQALPALEALAKAKAVEPESAATSYLYGLANLRLSRFPEAVAAFEAAVRIDNRTPTLRYQLSFAYQAAGHSDKAAEQLRETIRLDPQHASAHYKLGNLARQAGDQSGFQKHNLEFLRLRKLYGEETRSAEMLERCVYTQPESAPAPPAHEEPAIEVRFVDATDEVLPVAESRKADAVALIEVDEEGRYEWAVVEAGRLSLMRFGAGRRFERTPVETSFPTGMKFTSCLVGDFQDDVPAGQRYDARVHAKNDVLFFGPQGVCLLQRTGPTSFSNVTESAGLSAVKATAARWVDYDHDGDLDLLVGGPEGLGLWQNSGNGKFEDVTAKVGITPTGSVTDVAAVDLDANVAVDLVVARGKESTLVFENQRAGRFALMKEPPGPWPAAKRVLTDDLDNDGHPDVVLIGETSATILYGATTVRPRIEFGAMKVDAGRLVDYDNDGRLDLLMVGVRDQGPAGGAVRLWRNPGLSGAWADVSEKTGVEALSLAAGSDVFAADWDADGDGDLLVLRRDGRLAALRNDRGNTNKQLKLRLFSIKTNPSALGTHLELRAGDFRVTRSVGGLPIEIGVGDRQRIETVQTLWTNGVVDNQIDVEVMGRPLTILEKNVATGSCPFLYAWDGGGFRFVTDLLGNSPVGLSLSRDVMLPADPDEIVQVGGEDSIRPRDGNYVLQITDEFREVLYLDEAELLVVDHPANVEVHPTDKLMFPPFPTSEVWALGPRIPLRSAVGSEAMDRTPALREIDGEFAPPGSPLPSPYRGMCHPLTLTLDFGGFDGRKPLVLALTGWLQYGDASTNIALSQNPNLTIIPPRLFAETSGGEWVPVDAVVGMPAGKTKTILVDLAGRLPERCARLRLETTFEVRWDRIALFERSVPSSVQARPVRPSSAVLSWRGFSEIRSRKPDHPSTPEHSRVLDRPPWRTTLQGWCTRYGDVLDLVWSRDDRMVILNGGDALTLEFPASTLPPVGDGLRRTFFLFTVGWDKDADYNVVDGDTVEPIPVGDANRTATDDEYRLEYNTRWVPSVMDAVRRR